MYLRKSTESDDRQVLSIPAQERELRAAASRLGHTVLGDPVAEQMSAKRPGRPLFAEVVERVQRGEAHGILCWHLDRLARNPVDGAAIMWGLSERKIEAIVTPDRTWSGTGDDKLMMSIVFGMATKYSDDISRNVKRGVREAIGRGQWPARPKIGYLRDHTTMQLVPDPARWDIVREMWLRRAAGESIAKILRWATEEQQLRLPANRTRGRGTLPLSRLYRIFEDPFYAGLIRHKQGTAPGVHLPMISWDTYQRVQNLCPGSRPWTKTESQRTREFPYRGIMRCGRCQSMITAYTTTNRWGTSYNYYRCTRHGRPILACPEPPIDEKTIDTAVLQMLRDVTLPRRLVEWVVAELEQSAGAGQDATNAQRTRIEERLSDTQRRAGRARMLCVDGVLSEGEYTQLRDDIAEEQQSLNSQLASLSTIASMIQPWKTAANWLVDAENTYKNASSFRKQQILRAVGSNPQILGKKVLITANEAMLKLSNIQKIPNWSARQEYVKTLLGTCPQNQGQSGKRVPVWGLLQECVDSYDGKMTVEGRSWNQDSLTP